MSVDMSWFEEIGRKAVHKSVVHVFENWPRFLAVFNNCNFGWKKSLFSKQILLFSIIFSVRIKYDFFFFSFSYLLLSFQEYWFKLQLSFLSIYSLNIAAPILGIVNLHYWRKSSERSRNSEQLQQARDWYVFGIYSWWQVAWISIRDFWPLTTCY